MRISSEAFKDGGKLADKYSKQGSNMNPPVHFEDVPEKARSLALVVDDPDAPNGSFNHWILFNIDPKTRDIKEDRVPVMAMQGRNDFGEVEYDGPQPPSGEHHYVFKVYALDAMLPLSRASKRQDFEREIQGHVLDSATLTGTYAH